MPSSTSKRDFEIEFYKSEIARLKAEANNSQPSIDKNVLANIKEVVSVASEMRELLNKVRYEQISMSLAKQIDQVLKRAKDLD